MGRKMVNKDGIRITPVEMAAKFHEHFATILMNCKYASNVVKRRKKKPQKDSVD